MALTGGIIWGGTLFLTTLVSTQTGYASKFLLAIGSIYPGYSITILGSFIGLVYGFLDMYVGMYIIAWVYSKVK